MATNTRDGTVKKKTGRPKITYKSVVTKEVKEMIPKWKRQGQTDEWIAKKIGVGKLKLIEWKKEFPNFANLFKKGKADLLLELEETLYTRAKGHYVEDEEITYNSDGSEVRKTKKKFIWSDSNLQFALKKLDPDKWGDIKEDININIETKNASIDKVKTTMSKLKGVKR